MEKVGKVEKGGEMGREKGRKGGGRKTTPCPHLPILDS